MRTKKIAIAKCRNREAIRTAAPTTTPIAAAKPKTRTAIALSLIGTSLVAIWPLLAADPATPVQKLTPQIQTAFDRYISAAESREVHNQAAHKNFLTIDAQPNPKRTQSYGQLKSGQVLIERNHSTDDSPTTPAIRSLIHDWTATIFVPGVTLAQTLAALQDYDRDALYYSPQVTRSKLLARDGNAYQVALRLQQKYLFTVVLDTEYQILYAQQDATHADSQSRSTRIAEVEYANTPKEHQLAAGDDHGYLWRLNSYWHFYQAHGGVYIQCNAISLTRDAPIGLSSLIAPFIETIPRDSLRFTLTATREALLKKYPPTLNSQP